PSRSVCTVVPDLPGPQRPELAPRGVAAVGFKPGRFLSAIPEVMVAEADRLGIPLIAIPFHLSYSDLIHPLMRELVSRQASFLEQSDRLHRHLTEVALAAPRPAARALRPGPGWGR